MNPGTNTSQPGDIARAPDPGSPATSITVLAPPDATAGRIALFETRERRGAGPPLHRHSREDELVFVLDGRVTFHVASERITGSPGTCVVVPRGSEHGYVIESDHARLLVVLAPAEQGVEEWISEMSRCGTGRAVGSDSGAEAALAEQDIERLVARAARHGVEITGPRPDGSDGEPHQ